MSINYLFNSCGEHIANLVNGQLHAPTGQNIAHYLANEKIFIDMYGRYSGTSAITAILETMAR